MEMFFALLKTADISLSTLSHNFKEENTQEVPRSIFSEQNGKDLNILFKYAKHDAQYTLVDAKEAQFEDVVKTLRDGLSCLASTDGNSENAIKTEAVVLAFEKAMKCWPNANPSDIWWFIISRAYLDPFNHPAKFSKLNFEQSWKRTGGWALEKILVRHYSEGLKKKGINIFIASNEKRKELLSQAPTEVSKLEADKADVFLTGNNNGKEIFFGIVHVKSSFAERRTDDVPMSQVLVNAGYASPLWTMDCKSTPSQYPINNGELGKTKPIEQKKDKRSAKRKDIEDSAFFSACFSYNKNTHPIPKKQDAKARIYQCNFNSTESDIFHQFICESWKKFFD